MNICVVGTGYVGLVTGACFAEFGNHVICVDKDAAKIESLRRGEIPIYEPGLEALVERNARAGRLSFTSDLPASVQQSLVVFISVGTPQGNDGRADLSFVEAVAHAIGENLNAYKVVVTKSTVPAGTGRMVAEAVAARSGGEHPFSVASNPEFLREGSAIEDFMRPNRVVLGTEDETATAILRDLYRPLYLIETPILVTDVVTAEMIKYASNAFLAVKISYINEMADLCEALGADVHAVAKGMGLDRRIGAKFLHPGPGYGGSCFPKDTRALLEIARDQAQSMRIVDAAVAVNDARPERMLAKVREALGRELDGATLALLGLTFKPNTDDLRDSPALALLRLLLGAGARVRAYDPAGMEAARALAIDGVAYAADEYEAVEGADAVVLATEWNQFRGLDLERVREALNGPVMVDLRNVYERPQLERLGFRYVCVGR